MERGGGRRQTSLSVDVSCIVLLIVDRTDLFECVPRSDDCQRPSNNQWDPDRHLGGDGNVAKGYRE
jgi:hypothetical protein